MQKLDVMIGKMRLLLADIAAREEQALTLRRQFSDQRERVLGHGIYGNFPLSHMLGMLADADERLADVERTLRHLRLLRERVQAELESLELTKGIEEAKSELARLELPELERRLDLAARATTPAELDRLLADLPPLETHGPAPAPPAPHPALARRGTDLVVGLLGGAARTGAWTPARRTLVLAVMGGAELDFREARLPPGTTEVHVVAFMGGVEIVAPPELDLEVGGLAIMGGIDHQGPAAVPRPPGAPTVKVRALALMGGVHVEVRHPGESARDARRRLRAEAGGRARP